MPLVGTREMFKKAYDGGYAVGAFNVNNMELLQAIVDAGTEERSPLILQVSAGARKYARQEYLIHLVKAAMETTDIPVALHLDHGDSFELCQACVDGGFSSVMIDASHFPFEENVALTKKVVDYAHAKGVPVEAELGKLTSTSDEPGAREAVYTDPDEVVEFVKKTGCDSLAISIGTSHGAYKFKGEATLDFPRLEKIQGLLPGYPIVLHGASSVPADLVDICNKYGGKLPGTRGVPEEFLARAAKMAVCKINVDTDLRIAMTGAIRKVFAENPSEFDPRKYLGPAREAVKQVVKGKVKLFGCAGKA
ncbi:MAG: class II fructose-1,6-bisphosphate aldolase [Candidatus Edwardsbacteria bacterium]|nr:class II fructose-1,6-bisphosphate aldolase [Candidatus Edwardsbacteria bacterium]MBU1577006.1 class II fructose-1,6-bisphosphate aldolase [Candidatus Edwardsbacteria bacterium]MBU2464128.1 class II fructose-1,6-bisphosphate aldolase [Candidatus Edwardsbacteria bacterium]MBU2594817.1 class II fructose-1,6-bisphosphate aldolase [Candidatus Edwardsbacteria bacterium]